MLGLFEWTPFRNKSVTIISLEVSFFWHTFYVQKVQENDRDVSAGVTTKCQESGVSAL
jgi:hypothetical protein